jgi:putative DNA primase/helicase
MTTSDVATMSEPGLVISIFNNETDREPKTWQGEWSRLVAQLLTHQESATKSVRLWSPAIYQLGASRGNRGVESWSVAAFDIDDGTDAETLAYWLGDHEYVIASTYSYAPPDVLKFRVVMRLVEHVPATEYTNFWRRANQHLFHGHLDPSTKDAARMLYRPSCPPGAERYASHHVGKSLDWRALPPLPTPKPLPRRMKAEGSATDDQRRAMAMFSKWQNELAAMLANSGRHNRVLEIARAAGGLIASGLLSEAETSAGLFAACEANGLVGDDGERSVERTIADALGYGAREPWVPDDLPDSPTWSPTRRVLPSSSVQVPVETNARLESAPWPAPANIDGPTPPPGLPLDCFPTELVEHAEDIADRMQCPIDYVVWTLLVTLSTVIGRSVGIRPKRLDDWTERPALWVALIGDPSSMKTPGMNASVRLLHALVARLREEYRIAMQNWRAAVADARQANPKHPELPAEPQLRWLVLDDATTEKLSDLLQPEISRGLVFVRDEVSGLIRELERYRARAGDREFLLQSYSGGPKSVARVSRPPVFVPDLLLNIVGGIQPDVAREVFASGADDGLGERFLAIWPVLPSAFIDVDRFPNKERRDAFDLVAKKLYVADWSQLLMTDDFSQVPYCRVSSAAHDIFSAWRSRTVLSTRGDSPRYEHRFGRRVGKYPGLAARIALVLHLFEVAAVSTAHEAKANIATVDADVMQRVTRLMDSYVLPMEARVYSAYAVAPEAEGARRIARWILEARPERFTAREIRRHGWADLDDPLKVAAALEWLCSRDWLREADPQKRVGRPSDVFLVNPRSVTNV